MATLLFTALGTLIGGPLGGALGALAGRQIDGLILAPRGREGPRLKELAVTTSSYGSPIPRQFGTMRVPGTIIWSTDLIEHKTRTGGGKGRPSTSTYSYTVSFAVALSSRPLLSVGRIWADGNLLRGAAGDLKVAGSFRLHSGHGDQAQDPLIAAAEGVNQCPAFRGLAYAVFEDLDLSEFGNRIPALTFEVIADNGELRVAQLTAGIVPDCDAAVPLPGLVGLSADGPIGETLALLDPIFPMDCDAGERLTVARERLQSAPLALPEAAVTSADGKFGRTRGFARKRAPESESPLAALRYYDPARDFQPGTQRAPGRPLPGEPRTIELPAALEAASAQALIRAASRRAVWSRETLSWRVTELDPRIAPGGLVTLPGESGVWRVREWEWREDGIELSLLRLPPEADHMSTQVDPGRANLPSDIEVTPTLLAAFELPWDGTGPGNAPTIHAAASSTSSGWTGAALFAARGDGSLDPIGSSGRSRAIIGKALNALPARSPLLFDRLSVLEIELADPAMVLADTTPAALAGGANRALAGSEIVQFARAAPIAPGRWRLTGLWRGRGGTEQAIAGHTAGEPFVLLDGTPVLLDPGAIGSAEGVHLAAIGLADSDPVLAPIINPGLTLRPLAPVHGCASILADGTVRLGWTRRARGGWLWRDGTDTPLGESVELYDVAFGNESSTLTRWEVASNSLDVAPATLAGLLAEMPVGQFRIRQRGDFAASEPLVLPPPD